VAQGDTVVAFEDVAEMVIVEGAELVGPELVDSLADGVGDGVGGTAAAVCVSEGLRASLSDGGKEPSGVALGASEELCCVEGRDLLPFEPAEDFVALGVYHSERHLSVHADIVADALART